MTGHLPSWDSPVARTVGSPTQHLCRFTWAARWQLSIALEDAGLASIQTRAERSTEVCSQESPKEWGRIAL